MVGAQVDLLAQVLVKQVTNLICLKNLYYYCVQGEGPAPPAGSAGHTVGGGGEQRGAGGGGQRGWGGQERPQLQQRQT